jgi:predicted RNA-binding Zn-ribbon protein involved in translation (DUF1610 family)
MEYDRERYRAMTLPGPLMLHWVLNPGLALNEVILGQRMPALTLIDKISDKPLSERQHVPCPHCGHRNDGRMYVGRLAFGHWYGLVCADCGRKLPIVMNVFTIAVMALTFPVWMPLNAWLGPRMLARQHAALQRAGRDAPKPAPPASGLRMGLGFGVAMGLFFVVSQLVSGAELRAALAGGVTAGVLCGLLFGAAMKITMTWAGRGRSS